jgi:Peptidase A4 family
VETLPQPSQTVPLAVQPGDVISVSLTQQAGGTWQISMENQTTAQRYQTTVRYSSSLSSAEWIVEAPATATAGMRVVTLDDFGSVQVQGGTAVAGGQQVTIAAAGGQPITMHGRSGQPIADPSALGPDGASFTVTRLMGGGQLVAPRSGR